MTGDEAEYFVIPCHECQGGRCRLQHATYIAWFKNDLISVPNFPTWVCDLCGWREFDPEALAWLITVLNPPKERGAVQRAFRWEGDEGSVEVQRPFSE